MSIEDTVLFYLEDPEDDLEELDTIEEVDDSGDLMPLHIFRDLTDRHYNNR